MEALVLKYIGQSKRSNQWDPYDRFVEHSEKFLRQLLHFARSDISSCSSITSIQKKLVDFILSSLGKIQTDLQEYLIELEQSINDTICTKGMPNEITLAEITECVNNASCREWFKFGIAYIELFDIYGSYKVWDLGSIIAYFSPILTESEWGLAPKEAVLHNHFTELFRSLTLSNSSLSGYDIVALLAFDENSMKPTHFFPDFKKLPSVWNETNFIQTSEGFQIGCYLGPYDREWTDYMNNQTGFNVPCEGENNVAQSSAGQPVAACCKLRKKFNEKMYEIIRMMKYVQYPPHAVDQSEADPYNLTIQPDFMPKLDLNYPLYNNTEYHYSSSKKEIANPLIPFCSFNSKWDMTPYQTKIFGKPEPTRPYCSAFKPSFTDKGICYSWNNDKFSKLFTKSEYIEKMGDIFEYRSEDRPIVYPQANGPNYGFKFIIDAHTFSIKYKKYVNEIKDVDVVIHEKGALPYFK